MGYSTVEMAELKLKWHHYRVCGCCQKWFHNRIWARHNRACRKRQRKEAQRNEQKYNQHLSTV